MNLKKENQIAEHIYIGAPGLIIKCGKFFLSPLLMLVVVHCLTRLHDYDIMREKFNSHKYYFLFSYIFFSHIWLHAICLDSCHAFINVHIKYVNFVIRFLPFDVFVSQ